MDKRDNRKIRMAVYAKYDGRCAYCGCKITNDNFDIDHIHPKRRHETDPEKKGKDLLENYNPSCSSCNSSKRSHTIEGFRTELSMKIERIQKDSSLLRILLRYGLIKIIKKDITFYFETKK